MPYNVTIQDTRAQRRHERETEAYKVFSKVAKQIKYLEYGKWTISPDPDDPLRKIVLSRDIGWCTLDVKLAMDSHYHRGDYSDNRWDYYGKIVFHGLFGQQGRSIELHTSLRVRPRMAKKLLKMINENVIPNFYKEVEREKQVWEENHARHIAFQKNVAKIVGLEVQKDRWGDTTTALKGCPLRIRAKPDHISIDGQITYEEMAQIASAMGWGK